MTAGQAYFETANRLLTTLAAQEIDKIRQVAGAAARSVVAGGILHVFGSGHSSIPAQEVYIRAGSLTNTRPVSLERVLDVFERIEGVGAALMKNFDGRPGEVLIVFSNSGVNPLPVEVALEGRRRGLFTACVTSFEHSLRVEPKHSSGARLMDVVEVAIDSHVPYGDAGLEVSGAPGKVGPLSTLAGVSVVNAIMVETVEQIIALGGKPPVRISRNIPGGAEHNQPYIDLFGDRIPELKL